MYGNELTHAKDDRIRCSPGKKKTGREDRETEIYHGKINFPCWHPLTLELRGDQRKGQP